MAPEISRGYDNKNNIGRRTDGRRRGTLISSDRSNPLSSFLLSNHSEDTKATDGPADEMKRTRRRRRAGLPTDRRTDGAR